MSFNLLKYNMKRSFFFFDVLDQDTNHIIPELKLGCHFGSHSLDAGYWRCSGTTQPCLCCQSCRALSWLCWSLEKQISWVLQLCVCLWVQAHAGTLLKKLCSPWDVKVMNKTFRQLNPLGSGMSQNKSEWVPAHMELLRTFVAEIIPAELCASVLLRRPRGDSVATVLTWEPQPCKVPLTRLCPSQSCKVDGRYHDLRAPLSLLQS